MSRAGAFCWALTTAMFTLACSDEKASDDGTDGSPPGGAGQSASGGQPSDTAPGSGGTEPNAGAGGTGGEESGAGGATAVGGSASTIPGLDACPAPPAGVSDAAVLAINTMNTVRLAMGVPCAELAPELCQAAQNHCDYSATNQGDPSCEAPSAHNEIAGCPGFTGEGPGDRMRAAGYTSRGGTECMAFRNDPERAVSTFIDSVYHRTPVLSPWLRHIGYGGAEDCDTIDFGTGPETPDEVTAFYPYQGQTGVPPSFDGSREGPEPPMPPTGWPSGYPITLYARNITVTGHSIVVDGTTESLPHIWEEDSSAHVFYTETPLAANTTFRVTIDAIRGTEPLHFEWTFTTGEAGRW